MSAYDMVGEQHPADSSVKLNGPPGTGKTTQLLERLTGLLDDGYTVRDVTFVTYRKEMAAEFLRRLHDQGYISSEESEKPWKHDTRHFGTIHGVCNRITPDSEVVQNSHRRDFMMSTYRARYDGRGDDWDDAPGQDDAIGSLLFDAYDWCVENLTPDFSQAPNYDAIRQKAPMPPSFEDFHEEWEEYKRDGGDDGERLQDFAGMLRDVDMGGLTPAGDILIVDEYHDMTPIMSSICERWMDSFDTVIVGGDPLQSIYTYKGADPSLFTALDLPEVVLDRTYRVPAEVWRYAREVIQHETPDVTPDGDGGEVQAVSGPPHRVVEVYGGESTMYLARTQSQLWTIGEDLKSHGVIFRSQDGIGGWNNATTLCNLFNALQKMKGVEPADNVNPQTGQTGFGRYSDNDHETAEVRLPANMELTTGEARDLIQYTPAEHISDTKKSLISYTKATSSVTGDDLLPRVEPSFWGTMNRGPDSVDSLLSYDPKPTLQAALRRYDGPFETIETAPVPDVLTIHASKGKEADTVALYDGITPAVQRGIRAGRANERAESRVWYVACTRAAERLLIFRDQFDYCDRYLPSTP